MNLDNVRKSLDSQEPAIVAKGLQLIGRFGKLADLSAVLNFTKSNINILKMAAVSAASELIRSNLITHFDKMEPAMRQKLGTIMETLAPPVIDDIQKDLFCDDDLRRVRAIQILGLLKKNPRIREILANLVQDRNEKIRATAVNLLGKIVGPEDQELVLSLLNDKDKRVRANTVEALESVGNKKIVPLLLRFRKDPNNRIRGNVLKALFNLGFTDIEKDLLEMLENPDDFLRASGLWVISKIGIHSVTLEDQSGYHLLSDNEMVLINAKNALKSLGTPRALGYLRHLEKTAVKAL